MVLLICENPVPFYEVLDYVIIKDSKNDILGRLGFSLLFGGTAEQWQEIRDGFEIIDPHPSYAMYDSADDISSPLDTAEDVVRDLKEDEYLKDLSVRMDFDNAGHTMLYASVNELRRFKYSDALLLHLIEVKSRKHVLITVYPKLLGYNSDVSIEDFGTPALWPISNPSFGPGEIMIPWYNGKGEEFIKTLSYSEIKMDNEEEE